MPKLPPLPQLENLGSLITYKENGVDRCLGYLLSFEGKGVYEPSFGRVEVSAEHAAAHNKCLSFAEIEGLDHCEIGQCGSFYYTQLPGDGARVVVKTFTGDLVSSDAERKGKILTFRRKGKTFRGKISDNENLFLFKRIT